MLVHIVADHQVGGSAAGHKGRQPCQNFFQSVGVQPVVAVHDLIVQAGGIADALIDALAVTAVFLMDGLDDGGIFGGIFIADGRGVVLDGTIVHQNDLGLFACRQQRFDAVAHVSCGIVAGYGKGDKFLLHIQNTPFVVSCSGAVARKMEICILIIAFSPLKSYPSGERSMAFRTFCAKVMLFGAQTSHFVVY